MNPTAEGVRRRPMPDRDRDALTARFVRARSCSSVDLERHTMTILPA